MRKLLVLFGLTATLLVPLSGLAQQSTPQPTRYARISNLFVDNLYIGLTTKVRIIGIASVATYADAVTLAVGPNPLFIRVAKDVDNVWALYYYEPDFSLNPNHLERQFFDTGSATSGQYGPVTVNYYSDAKAIANGPYPKTIRVLYDSNSGNYSRTYYYWPDSLDVDKLEPQN